MVEELEIQSLDELGFFGKKKKKKGGKKKKKKKRPFAKVGLAPARGAFMTIVNLNLLKMAEKLKRAASKDRKRIEKFWRRFGGNPSKFFKAIDKGATRKERRRKRKGKMNGPFVLNGFEYLDELGEPIAVGAALATATPIVIAVTKILKDMKVTSPEEEGGLKGAISSMKNALRRDVDTTKGAISTDIIPEGFDVAKRTEETPSGDDGGAGMSTGKMIAIGGGIAAAAGILYFTTRK